MWTADAAIASVGRRVIHFEADGSVLYTGQGLGTQACNVLMSLR
jgi:thiamine pyrophosphate-dependent acetolactate synthase large subunit-like protein